MSEHIFRPFEAELQGLKEQILTMGSLVETQVAEAVKAFTDRDAERAGRLIEADRAVDQLELAIDEQCIRMLALRQPAAGDLRFLASALKIVTDLERIGDLAVNMAQRTLSLASLPPLRVGIDIPRMAAKAQQMLSDALDAFVSRDVAKAQTVIEGDKEVDDLMTLAFDVLVGQMRADPDAVVGGLATLFFAKHIERMADHTTNLAEMVVYLVRGQDVRHHNK